MNSLPTQPRPIRTADEHTCGVLDIIVKTSQIRRESVAHFYLGSTNDSARITYWLRHYYEREPHAEVRRDLVRFARPFTTQLPEAIDFLISAMDDRAYWVRESVLFGLAASQSPMALAALKTWKPPLKARVPQYSPYGSDAMIVKKAINAIEKQDIKEFIRDTIYSGISDGSYYVSDKPGSAEFRDGVDTYIKGYAPELVPALTALFGSIYIVDDISPSQEK